MQRDDSKQHGSEQARGDRVQQQTGRPAPGKVTRTARLPASPERAVQRKSVAPGTGAAAPRAARESTASMWMDAAHRGSTALSEQGQAAVQARGNVQAEDPASVHRAAAAGVSGSGGALPHLDRIQAAFGDHDLSNVRAHVGGEARAASEQMGARAFATGDHIAFGDQPDLHTAAHEAAHVVQQRAGVQLSGGVGQAGDSYERNADAVADAVVRGESAAELLGQGAPGAAAGAAGGVQMMRMSAADQAAYTKLTGVVQNRIPNASNDRRVVNALNTYGTNIGSTARNIASDLAWGSGPTIKVAALSGAFGEFSPGVGSQELRVDQSMSQAFENEANAGRQKGHELLVEDTILHEYTHYLDDQDGADLAGEEGEQFETAVYGQVINGVSDALSILEAKFGAGDWTVRVEGKEAGYQQRFIISGAKSGNGTHTGATGTSVSVKADAGTTWQLRIQHDDGTHGWQESSIHKVREGADDYLVRSEDWTDRDMNDLEIRVKK